LFYQVRKRLKDIKKSGVFLKHFVPFKIENRNYGDRNRVRSEKMINLEIPIIKVLPNKVKQLFNGVLIVSHEYSLLILDNSAAPTALEINSNLGRTNQNIHTITIALSDHEEAAF
jgi:hypothetical protein